MTASKLTRRASMAVLSRISVSSVAVFAVVLSNPAFAATSNFTTTWQFAGPASANWTDVGAWSAGVPDSNDAAVIDNGGLASIAPGDEAAAEWLVLGDEYRGTVNQTGGSLQLGRFGLVLGAQPSAEGFYLLSGGELQSTRNVSVGGLGQGDFRQSGGVVHVTNGSVQIADSAGSTGVFRLEDGQLIVSEDLSVGRNGEGQFNQENGNVQISERLWIGNTPTATGTYRFESGMLSTGVTIVGGQGTGMFEQTGGIHTAAVVTIGLSTAASDPAPKFSTYTLREGKLQVTNNMFVGDRETGSFVQHSGETSIGGLLSIGAGSGPISGSYELHGGILTVDREIVGSGAMAVFHQNGGVHSIAGDLEVGPGSDVTATVGPTSGVFNLTDGELFVGDNVRLGGRRQRGKPAEFHQTGGVHEITGNLIIAPDTVGLAGYHISDGVLDVFGDVRIGTSVLSNGTLEIAGGEASIRVRGDFIMGPVNQFFQNPILKVEIGPSGVSTINVDGEAILRGRLGIELQPGFLPKQGTTYELLFADEGVSGSLEMVGGAAALFDFAIGENSVRMTAIIPEPSSAMLVAMLIATFRIRRATTRNLT